IFGCCSRRLPPIWTRSTWKRRTFRQRRWSARWKTRCAARAWRSSATRAACIPCRKRKRPVSESLAARLLRRPRAVAVNLVRNRTLWMALGTMLLCALLTGMRAGAQGAGGVVLPKVTVGVDTARNPQDVAVTLQILLLMTILTLAPSILILTTAFTRLIIVFSILRSALGTPQIPPNQVLVGLSLFLTFFIMQPVFTKINTDALQPYFANKIALPEALDKAEKPLHDFMIRQTYTSDLT